MCMQKCDDSGGTTDLEAHAHKWDATDIFTAIAMQGSPQDVSGLYNNEHWFDNQIVGPFAVFDVLYKPALPYSALCHDTCWARMHYQ
jgi:hypothetical protein